MKERWLPMPNNPRYQISNYGNIKSLSYNKSGKEKLLKKFLTKYGYETVSIQENGKSKTKWVHRLVAELFIPNPENKPQVNHIDGNKSNNRADNLEWATGSENVQHYYYVLKGRTKKIPSGRKIGWQRKPVICVETGEIFPSIRSAAESIGVCDKAISQLLSNPPNRHTAGGYHWKLYGQ